MDEIKKAPIWSSVDNKDWEDWKWQYKNRITTFEQLEKLIELDDEDKEDIKECLKKFRMAITPYYASLIDTSNPRCPIRLQSVPTIYELETSIDELEDPLDEEKYSPVPGIVHKYPDRVLFLLTARCSMYCRHCTRRRFAGNEDYNISKSNLNSCIEYITCHSEIRDVLLSGGDPFTLNDDYLEGIIKRLREIPHVEVIRIGTRTPVVLPMRITDNLIEMLKKYHPIWINTHFNHPKEITNEAINACLKIVNAGIPLGNQTVLLKGVNDEENIIKELCLKLVKNRVRPYYLYQCDIAQGIKHFRTPVQKGIDILAKMQGYISGFAITKFVIDAPKGGGKIPISKQYIISLK